MPSRALGKDICEGATSVDGKMESPFWAAHGGGSGVQQYLFSWDPWENWTEEPVIRGVGGLGLCLRGPGF